MENIKFIIFTIFRVRLYKTVTFRGFTKANKRISVLMGSLVAACDRTSTYVLMSTSQDGPGLDSQSVRFFSHISPIREIYGQPMDV